MLMPVVLGIVKRKMFGGGGFSQNAGGLLSLLNGQKDNVQAAMPNGFQNQLQSSGFLDQMSSFGGGVSSAAGNATGAVGNAAGNVTGAVGNVAGNAAGAVGNVAGNAADAVGNAASNATGAVGNVASNVTGAVGDAAGNVTGAVGGAAGAVGGAASGVGNAAGNAASSGGGLLRKFLPIAAIVAIALLAWKFISGNKAPEVPDVSANMPSVQVGDIDVGGEVDGIFSGATDAVSGITDADSATAAIPALEGITGKVDGLSGMMDKIPEGSRGSVTDMIGGKMGGLQEAVDKASELPGVGAILGPVAGPLMEKLQGLIK